MFAVGGEINIVDEKYLSYEKQVLCSAKVLKVTYFPLESPFSQSTSYNENFPLLGISWPQN